MPLPGPQHLLLQIFGFLPKFIAFMVPSPPWISSFRGKDQAWTNGILFTAHAQFSEYINYIIFNIIYYICEISSLASQRLLWRWNLLGMPSLPDGTAISAPKGPHFGCKLPMVPSFRHTQLLGWIQLSSLSAS